MAICVMAVVDVAPCQCFSPGGHPDHVAGPDLHDRTSPAPNEAAAGCHDQRLAQRMHVPCCPSAGLKRNSDGENARRMGRLEQWVNAYHAGKIFVRSFA